jgi:hypothetical protein
MSILIYATALLCGAPLDIVESVLFVLQGDLY